MSSIYRWPREDSWWDELEIPYDAMEEGDEGVFRWLRSVAPAPEEHDYVLYTDGSGNQDGWGASAALIEKVDLVVPDVEERHPHRAVVDTSCLMSGTYGSTVQRMEMTAFLDGIHWVLSDRIRNLKEDGTSSLYAGAANERAIHSARYGPLGTITGPDRPRVLWYTDRQNLALALLFTEDGAPLSARSSDVDLWMRYSYMARHVCVTPMHARRNTVRGQEKCDALCGVARKVMKDNMSRFSEAADKVHNKNKWIEKRQQKAEF
jgi:hypothetical protein